MMQVNISSFFCSSKLFHNFQWQLIVWDPISTCVRSCNDWVRLFQYQRTAMKKTGLSQIFNDITGVLDNTGLSFGAILVV